MTIHKSKGLEFDTVIFIGLEDSQWWSFSTQAEEEKRGFFVAFSRAIAHVFFTFCDVRVGKWGRKRDTGKGKYSRSLRHLIGGGCTHYRPSHIRAITARLPSTRNAPRNNEHDRQHRFSFPGTGRHYYGRYFI